jgi:hypothetical protein
MIAPNRSAGLYQRSFPVEESALSRLVFLTYLLDHPGNFSWLPDTNDSPKMFSGLGIVQK